MGDQIKRNKQAILGFRTTEEIIEMLKALTAESRRSKTAEIEYMIQQAYKKLKH